MGFDDVTLDCAGALTGWQPVGKYEYTRVDLMHRQLPRPERLQQRRAQDQEPEPLRPLGVGLGHAADQQFTANVSYGYPGGMNVQPINTVVIPPMPQ